MYNDTNLDASKQSDTEPGISVTGTVQQGFGGPSDAVRSIGKYTYRVVHTQESVRLLDMRLDIAELENIEDLPRLCDDFVRSVLRRAIEFEAGLVGFEGIWRGDT